MIEASQALRLEIATCDESSSDAMTIPSFDAMLACFEDTSFMYNKNNCSSSSSSSFSSSSVFSVGSSRWAPNSKQQPHFHLASPQTSSVSSTCSFRSSSRSSCNSFASTVFVCNENTQQPPQQLTMTHHRPTETLSIISSTTSGYSTASPSSASCVKKSKSFHQDEDIFFNLILKERNQLQERHLLLQSVPCASLGANQSPLDDTQSRHRLLSWMLRICEQEACQDEIFPLATMILDKFFLFNNSNSANSYASSSSSSDEENKNKNQISIGEITQTDHNNNSNNKAELHKRQLYLFAACALLLATKLRQTPRLSIETLIEFSLIELPVEFLREEIVQCELLILVTLKWDLAALVTPNDFLSFIMEKCVHLTSVARQCNPSQDGRQDSSSSGKAQTILNEPEQQHQNNSPNSMQDQAEFRVRRHSQAILELCLMDCNLSQFPASILAMGSVAVAIYGMCTPEKTCWRLREIVTQIYEATHRVNKLELMIDSAMQIEQYVLGLVNI